MMTDQKRQSLRRGRRFRRIAITLIVLLVLLLLAPMIVSRTFGPSLLASAIAAKLDGQVSVERTSLSWFRAQRIDGLRIAHTDGAPIANVNVTLESSLLNLIRGVDVIELAVDGEARATRRADGSFDVAELIPAREESSSGPLPALHVDLSNLVLTLRDEAADQTVTMHASGEVATLSSGDASVAIDGSVSSGELDGQINLELTATALFDPLTGAFDPTGGLAARVTGSQLPLLFTNQIGRMEDLQLTLSGADLSKTFVVSVDTSIDLLGSGSSWLRGALTVSEAFDGDQLAIGLDHVSGHLIGNELPTAPFQPLVERLGVDLERDLGRVIRQLELALPVGFRDMLKLTVMAPYLTVDVEASVDAESGTVRSDHITAAWRVHPELLASTTPLRIEDRVEMLLQLDSLALPIDRVNQLDLASVGAAGTFTIAEPLRAAWVDQPAAAVDLRGLSIDIDAPSLTDAVTLAGRIELADGSIDINQRCTGLLGAEGGFDFSAVRAHGALSARGLPAAFVSRIVPEHERALSALLGESFDLAINTGGDELLAASVALTAANLTADLNLAIDDDMLRVEAGEGGVTITDDLLTALLAGSEEQHAVDPRTPLDLHWVLEPLTLISTDRGWRPQEALVAHIRSDEIGFEALPVIQQRLGMADLETSASLTIDRDGFSLHLQGAAHLFDPMTFGAIANTGFDLRAGRASADDASTVDTLKLRLEQIDVTALEQALGRETGTYSAWLGEYGSLGIDAAPIDDGYDWSASVQLDRFQGQLDGSYVAGWIEIEPAVVQWTIDRTALNKRLARARGQKPRPHRDPIFPRPRARLDAAPAPLQLAKDIAAQLAIMRWRLPTRDAVDRTEAAALDVEFTAPDIRLSRSGENPMHLESLIASLASDDVTEGIQLSVTAEPFADGPLEADAPPPLPPDAAGQIDIRGQLDDVLNESGTFDLARAGLTGSVNVSSAPTALVDALAGFDGLLLAALGPEVTLRGGARSFSTQSGQLDFEVMSTHGGLRGRTRAEDRSLRIDSEHPVSGTLDITTSLTQRLLPWLHPVLSDIRSAQDPVRVTLRDATLPLDGDLSRLNGTIEINIGPVDFDAGSATLLLMKIANSSRGNTFAGSVAPIHLTITDGVVTYERFEIAVDKYTLSYEGSIDLITREVNLRTALPLEGLAMSMRELRGYADRIIVPIITRGTFGAVKTEIDPDFNLAEAALKAGFEGVLEDTLPDELKIIKDIFDIFGGGS